MSSSFYQDFFAGELAQRAAGVRPTVVSPRVSTPSPFDTRERDRSFRKFGFGNPYSRYASSGSNLPADFYSSDDSNAPFTGQFQVSTLSGTIEDRFVGAPGALRAAIAPTGLGAFMGIGSAMSYKMLSHIEKKMLEGDPNYGLAVVNGRIIGVSPGIFGDKSFGFTGALPTASGTSINLSHDQRVQLRDLILGAGKPLPYRQTPDYFPGAVDEQVGVAPPPEPTDEERAAAAGSNIVYDDSGNPVKVGNTDDYVTTESGKYVDQAELQKQNAARQAAEAQARARAAAEEAARSRMAAQRDDNDNNQPTGRSYSINTSGSSNPADRGGYRMNARGGYIGMADGGSADPVQGNGFVDGSPDNYTKSQTVADDEYRRVRPGSFVMNAPMTEKLQEAGLLPKGVDNPAKKSTIKANKGGMIDVALSKGEYVFEPEEAKEIGYDVLNKINDMGKPEVDRRQAARGGGFVDGYNNGGQMGMLRYAGPLSAIELMKSGLSVTTPEGFIGGPTTYDGPYPSSETDAPSEPIPPLLINGIDIAKVGKGLSRVEIRGYEDKNDGYIYTKSGTRSNPSTAFGPLQLTHSTVKAMLQKPDRKKKIKGGSAQLLMEMKQNPEFRQYVVDFEQDLRNRANVTQYNEIHTGGGFFDPQGTSTKRRPTAEEKQFYKNLGTGAIAVERHREHYPTLANLYLAYKAEMSDSEEDMVKRHFGNTKSTAKYFEALEELGLNK
jgi:hypothetical protein